jgi:hypothetical protein
MFGDYLFITMSGALFVAIIAASTAWCSCGIKCLQKYTHLTSKDTFIIWFGSKLLAVIFTVIGVVMYNHIPEHMQGSFVSEGISVVSVLILTCPYYTTLIRSAFHISISSDERAVLGTTLKQYTFQKGDRVFMIARHILGITIMQLFVVLLPASSLQYLPYIYGSIIFSIFISYVGYAFFLINYKEWLSESVLTSKNIFKHKQLEGYRRFFTLTYTVSLLNVYFFMVANLINF